MKAKHKTRIAGVLALAALAVGTTAFAGDNALPFTDALVDELQREVAELSLPDAPDIYHLRYHAVIRDSTETRAAYGAVLQIQDGPANSLATEVRVGDPSFDNTGFVGGDNGFMSSGLPDVPTTEAVLLDAWRMTDAAFKAAVSHYATKAAEYTQPPDHPGDFQMTGPVSSEVTERSTVDPESTRALATRLSTHLPDGPNFERAEVLAYHTSGLQLTVDSEGSRVVRPTEEAGVRAVAFARCEDGSLLSDHRSWFGRSPDQWPSEEAMTGEIEVMANRLEALVDAQPLEEEYVGPVVFENEATVDLFRYLLVAQLEGTPDEAASTGGRGIFGSARKGAGGVRLSRRVLPPGWSVVDDPQTDPEHVAAFAYDDEGSPTEAVTMVTDGIVKDVLMSRVPRLGVDGTNGHARTNFYGRAKGRAMMMSVTPDSRVSQRKMYKKALRLARAYDRDYVIVVRRLQDPPVRGYADFASRVALMLGPGGASLPPPIYAVKRYADGREESIRGLSFANVQRFALRDIAAAGAQVSSTYLAQLERGVRQSGLTDGFPTWLSAPEVLVGELELVPASGDPKDKGIIPPPSAPSP